MIVFNLSCANHHQFEGWFESATNFESQQQSKLLSCPVCGIDEVNKELHAPYVNTGAAHAVPNAPAKVSTEPRQAIFNKAVAELVDHLMASTEDVGNAFPEEARKIHYNEAPERPIRGHATSDEIASLKDEGIDVVSVPIPKHRMGNTH